MFTHMMHVVVVIVLHSLLFVFLSVCFVLFSMLNVAHFISVGIHSINIVHKNIFGHSDTLDLIRLQLRVQQLPSSPSQFLPPLLN